MWTMLQARRQKGAEEGRSHREGKAVIAAILSEAQPPPPVIAASMPCLPPASIKDAIEFYDLFKQAQAKG